MYNLKHNLFYILELSFATVSGSVPSLLVPSIGLNQVLENGVGFCRTDQLMFLLGFLGNPVFKTFQNCIVSLRLSRAFHTVSRTTFYKVIKTIHIIIMKTLDFLIV